MRYWLPPLIWSAMILAASGDWFSASQTGGLLRLLLERLVRWHPTDEQFEIVHYVTRKSGHLLAYAILGWLFLRAIRAGRRERRLSWSAAAVALSIAVAVADEAQQSLSRQRTGVPSDVVIDACGASIVQIGRRREMK